MNALSPTTCYFSLNEFPLSERHSAPESWSTLHEHNFKSINLSWRQREQNRRGPRRRVCCRCTGHFSTAIIHSLALTTSILAKWISKHEKPEKCREGLKDGGWKWERTKKQNSGMIFSVISVFASFLFTRYNSFFTRFIPINQPHHVQFSFFITSTHFILF